MDRLEGFLLKRTKLTRSDYQLDLRVPLDRRTQLLRLSKRRIRSLPWSLILPFFQFLVMDVSDKDSIGSGLVEGFRRY